MSDPQSQRTLGDVTEINPETLPAGTARSRQFRYIDLGAVKRGRLDWSSIESTTFAAAPSRARRVTRAGDVLFGTVRPGLESHGIIPGSAQPGEFVVSTGFAVLRARPTLAHAGFLGHYCFSQAVRDDARRRESGSSYPAVSESDVKGFRFPTLTVAQQSVIATILDAMAARIRTCEEVIAKLERIRAAVLEKLLADARMASMDTRTLASATSKIVDGVHHTPTYVDRGVPFLTVENLTRGPGISTSPCRFVSRRAHEEYRKRIEPLPGDVLVSKDGTLGVARLVPRAFSQASVFVSVAVLRPITEVIEPEFLRLFFDTEDFQRQLRVLSAGSGLQHIHLEHFRAFAVPDLSIAQQREVASGVALVDARLFTERAILKRLNLQAAGLMEDLLTGRVAVPTKAAL